MDIGLPAMILSWLARLWQVIRGRPTVQASQGSVAAGHDISGAAVAGDQPQIAQTGGTIYAPTINVENLNLYVDGLPTATNPQLREHFQAGLKLQELGRYYQQNYRHDEAIEHFKIALQIAQDDSQRCAVYILMSHSYIHLGRFVEAEGCSKEALEIAERDNDPEAKVSALHHLTMATLRRGDLGQAESRFRRLANLLIKANDWAGLISTTANLGLIYWTQGKLEQAEEVFKLGLTAARKGGDKRAEAKYLGNLGLVQRAKGNLARAIRYHHQALAINRRIDNKVDAAIDLLNLGAVYRTNRQPEAAQRSNAEALQLAREIGLKPVEANALGNLGAVALDNDEVAKAHDYIKQAMAINKEIGNPVDEAIDASNLGDLYLRQGLNNEALSMYTYARDLLIKAQARPDIIAALEARIARARSDA